MIKFYYFFWFYRSTEEFLNAPFPKLKKLYLSFKRCKKTPLVIDFTRFSETLEELYFDNERLADSTLMSIASLKKLKVLSLSNTLASYISFPKALSSLTQLR